MLWTRNNPELSIARMQMWSDMDFPRKVREKNLEHTGEQEYFLRIGCRYGFPKDDLSILTGS